jgi:hypothetical protein
MRTTKNGKIKPIQYFTVEDRGQCLIGVLCYAHFFCRRLQMTPFFAR